MIPERSRKKRILCPLILVCCLAAAVLCGGCVTEEKPFSYTMVPLSDETEAAQAELLESLKNMDLILSLDLYYLADEIGTAESYAEAYSVVNTYYATHSWLNRVVYVSNTSGKSFVYPVAGRENLTDSLPSPTKEELLASGGILNLGPVLVPGHGWMELMYVPVFSPAGEYKGYLLLIFDLQTMLREHELFRTPETSYNTYAITLVNQNGKVAYATQQEFIGLQTNTEEILDTGVSRILLQPEEKSGAYRYQTEHGTVTTAWQQYSAHKNQYTLYLTKEDDPKPVNYTAEILTPQPDAMRTAVIDAWIYAGGAGYEAALDRINAGYYPHTLYGIDRNGTILAAPPDKQYTVGMNFLNVYDTYGVSFVQQGVYTGNLGGGYFMYCAPIDASWMSAASEFRIGYIMPVDEERYIAGLSPGEAHLLPNDYTARADVTSVSRAIVAYAHTYGIDAAIEKINRVPHANGTLFVEGITTEVPAIGLQDYDGLAYTASYIPSLIGQSLTFYTDILGSSVNRRAVMLAKSGGGMIYDYQWSRTSPGDCTLWLYSVEPINPDYFIMSGAPVAVVKNYVQEGILPKNDVLPGIGE